MARRRVVNQFGCMICVELSNKYIIEDDWISRLRVDNLVYLHSLVYNTERYPENDLPSAIFMQKREE